MTDTTKDGENTRQETSEITAQSECNGLLCCPECGFPPDKYCTIDVVRAREPHDKNCVTAKCNYCGLTITIFTNKNPKIIRKYWNYR